MDNNEIKSNGYPTISDIQIQCMLNNQIPKYKNLCYFYHEERDMCAIIPTCNYYGQLGYCPCENCDKYVPRYEVYGMIKKIVDERNKDNG